MKSGGISDSMRAALAQAARGRGSGKTDKPVKVKPKRQEPTPEQRRHMRYELEAVTERGQVIGQAYRRHPWFETMFKQGHISFTNLNALRFYRAAFEGSFFSETRCALDFSIAHGGGTGYSVRTEPAEVSMAKHNLALCEAGIASPMLDTLRAIGLHDMRIRDVAMERFGSRAVPYIVNGEHLTKPAPLSGRHREAVKIELDRALAILAGNVATMARTER